MLAKVMSGTVVGLTAVPIEIEVDVASRGLPSLTIVGLADKAVQEAKERVRAALMNSGTELPSRRITINLAPADLPKQGPAFDLPIALALLLASGTIQAKIDDCVVMGELSLDGSVRPVTGALPLALMARREGYSTVILPQENAAEAAIVDGLTVLGVESLKSFVNHLLDLESISPTPIQLISDLLTDHEAEIDMADVHGQDHAKRALELTAAGGHNVYLHGVPGAGKTMLSRAFAGILPQLTEEEALEVTKIYSIAGQLPPDTALVSQRPFRSPHHSTSKVGLIGGGSIPQPGEISLAHRGVLFLDEFPEFTRSSLESLRQPLEDGTVHIARAAQTNTFPCRFTLIAAANPCPCGHLGSQKKACTCSSSQITRYQKKISGPIMDRIDLHVHVSAVEVKRLAKTNADAERSSEIRKRVQKARNIQTNRFSTLSISTNAEMSTKQVKEFCPLSSESQAFLTQAAERLQLSARSYFKSIKVARTIADLSGSEKIQQKHLAEALQYRPTDYLR